VLDRPSLGEQAQRGGRKMQHDGAAGGRHRGFPVLAAPGAGDVRAPFALAGPWSASPAAFGVPSGRRIDSPSNSMRCRFASTLSKTADVLL